MLIQVNAVKNDKTLCLLAAQKITDIKQVLYYLEVSAGLITPITDTLLTKHHKTVAT